MPNVYTDPSAGGNVPNWEEDANSPFTGTGASSYQYTVAGNYDIVRFVIDGGIAQNTLLGDEIQINGDTTTNYEYVDNADTKTQGDNQWSLGNGIIGFSEIRFTILSDFGVAFSTLNARSSNAVTLYGNNINVAPSIDTITIRDGGGTNFEINIRVYGWNF